MTWILDRIEALEQRVGALEGGAGKSPSLFCRMEDCDQESGPTGECEAHARQTAEETKSARPLRVYVASSWRNGRQPEVVTALRAAGHEVYDFRNPAPGDHGFGWRQVNPDPPPWSADATREVLAHPIAERGFGLDFGAMKWADAVVMVQPCGRSAALELGWCAGAGKRAVVLLADGQEPELMFKVAGHLCTSLDEVLAALVAVPTVQMESCKACDGRLSPGPCARCGGTGEVPARSLPARMEELAQALLADGREAAGLQVRLFAREVERVLAAGGAGPR